MVIINGENRVAGDDDNVPNYEPRAGEILRIFHFWWRHSRGSRLEQESPIDTHEMQSSGEHWESETKDTLTLMNIMWLLLKQLNSDS